MERDNRANRYSPETRARAVRMVFENQGNYASQAAAIKAIAPKIGCGRDTLRRWVQHEEADTGQRDGVTSGERSRSEPLMAPLV
ncbi:transposase, partial [Tropicibacter naphthalenivorans]|uniref:transposase n=1 Tax=Tropicibacter naphthalenivorans TaxID=441103 RepID=UPI0009D90185